MLKQTGKRAEPSLAFGSREIRYLLVWISLSVGFLVVFAAVIAVMSMIQFLAMLALYLVLLVVGLADALVVGQRDQFVIVLWISVFFAMPAASYVAGRLTLVLPALAVDRRRPLRQAWRLSAGNGWRLVAASLLVLVPMELIATLCSAAAGGARHTVAYFPLDHGGGGQPVSPDRADGDYLVAFLAAARQRGAPRRFLSRRKLPSPSKDYGRRPQVMWTAVPLTATISIEPFSPTTS